MQIGKLKAEIEIAHKADIKTKNIIEAIVFPDGNHVYDFYTKVLTVIGEYGYLLEETFEEQLIGVVRKEMQTSISTKYKQIYKKEDRMVNIKIMLLPHAN